MIELFCPGTTNLARGYTEKLGEIFGITDIFRREGTLFQGTLFEFQNQPLRRKSARFPGAVGPVLEQVLRPRRIADVEEPGDVILGSDAGAHSLSEWCSRC
jgi:hypothetical protein